MVTVRAKFKVNKIELTSHRPAVRDEKGNWVQQDPVQLRTIVMSPVYSDDPGSENRKFWNASPSGEIRLGTINEAAWSAFEIDGEYYVEFKRADGAR
jgi:hypothetical protein